LADGQDEKTGIVGMSATRLQDPNLAPYYKALAPILEDILKRHDYVLQRIRQRQAADNWVLSFLTDQRN
jgi:hypothetical protein